jgi:transposase-like protein
MTEQELIALWHGADRAKDIAQRLGIRPTYLTVEWRRLKREHKLPPGERPRNPTPGNEDEFLRRLDAAHPERRSK